MTMAEPSDINSPGKPLWYIVWFLTKLSTEILFLKTWSHPVTYPVDFCIKYLNHVLPDPGYENNPVLGPGGSKILNDFPKHQGMELFLANKEP